MLYKMLRKPLWNVFLNILSLINGNFLKSRESRDFGSILAPTIFSGEEFETNKVQLMPDFIFLTRNQRRHLSYLHDLAKYILFKEN